MSDNSEKESNIVEFKSKKEIEENFIFTCNCGCTLYEFNLRTAKCFRCGNELDTWPEFEG